MIERPSPEEMPEALIAQLKKMLAEDARNKSTGERGLYWKTTCGGVNPDSVSEKKDQRVFAK